MKPRQLPQTTPPTLCTMVRYLGPAAVLAPPIYQLCYYVSPPACFRFTHPPTHPHPPEAHLTHPRDVCRAVPEEEPAPALSHAEERRQRRDKVEKLSAELGDWLLRCNGGEGMSECVTMHWRLSAGIQLKGATLPG